MSSILPNRLKELREENRFTQENVAIKIGVTTKTYRTWEKDIEKMKSGIKSINLIALAHLYSVSTDYILGLSNCKNVSNHYISEKTGLNDDSINALELLKLQDENEKRNQKILNSIRDFIYSKYKIPVYYDKDNGKWVCPKSDYEFSKGQFGFQDIWWLNLASNEAAPYDNKPIILSDTFFESVAIKDIEKQLYDLRNLYYEVNEKK